MSTDASETSLERTREILQKMEDWYETKKEEEDSDINDDMPFKNFDGLLGANLINVDLSSETIQKLAKEWMERYQKK